MAVKATWKRKIQNVLSECSKGVHTDQSWRQVHVTWKALQDIGCTVIVMDAAYQTPPDSLVPVSKTWKYILKADGFSFNGILIAFGAGSVNDPLEKYDIAAYLTD